MTSQYEWPNMPIEWLADALHTGDPEKLRRNPSVSLDKIRDEKMVMLHVTTSYGCEILALCKSITVQELASD